MAASISCAAIDCEYITNHGYCRLKHIDLSDHSVMTVWDGRQRFQRCKMWQKSERAAVIEKNMAMLLEKLTNENRSD